MVFDKMTDLRVISKTIGAIQEDRQAAFITSYLQMGLKPQNSTEVSSDNALVRYLTLDRQ